MSTRNIYVARPSSSHHTLYYRRLTSPSLRLEKDLALSLREWQGPSFILERPGVSRVDNRLWSNERRTADEIRFTVFFLFSLKEIYQVFPRREERIPRLRFVRTISFQVQTSLVTVIRPLQWRSSKSGKHAQFENKWRREEIFFSSKLGSVGERRTLENFQE